MAYVSRPSTMPDLWSTDQEMTEGWSGWGERPSEIYVDEERPHLGGFITGGDPLSHYPALWEWFVDELDVQSVIDVGCGQSAALAYFWLRGCDVLGVDGIEQETEWPFLCHDYAEGPYIPSEPFELAWSCEFVEHVEEQFMDNFLATFQCAEMVAMTHAIPGQGGYHHVNCQEKGYWIDALKSIGHRYDAYLTDRARVLAGQGYFAYTGLIFS